MTETQGETLSKHKHFSDQVDQICATCWSFIWRILYFLFELITTIFVITTSTPSYQNRLQTRRFITSNRKANYRKKTSHFHKEWLSKMERTMCKKKRPRNNILATTKTTSHPTFLIENDFKVHCSSYSTFSDKINPLVLCFILCFFSQQ